MSSITDQFQEIIGFIKQQFPGKGFIPFYEPVFSVNERKYVLDCIDSTFISAVGKYVSQFKNKEKRDTF